MLSLVATLTWGLGALCSVLYRLRFSRFCWGLGRSFFIGGGENGSFLRLLEVFAVDFVGFALGAVGAVVLAFAGVVFASLSRLFPRYFFSRFFSLFLLFLLFLALLPRYCSRRFSLAFLFSFISLPSLFRIGGRPR